MSHAAHQRKHRLSGQHFGNVGPIEPGLCHDRIGQAVLGRNLVNPAGFGNRVVGRPFGLDVYRTDQIECRAVAPKVVGQVVAANCGIVAISKRNHRLVLQPGLPVFVEIPNVMMCIDDGQRAQINLHQ